MLSLQEVKNKMFMWKCKNCGSIITVADGSVSADGKCPECNEVFVLLRYEPGVENVET